MPEIVVAISTFVASAAIAVTGSAAVAAWTYGATAYLLTTVAPAVILGAVARSMAPKLPVAQRQADILELSLGEHPREAIFGRAVTGGSLMDAFNYGTDNEWEVMVIALADHRCVALEGYYVNEAYYEFSADGVQSGFSNCLEIYWRPGTLTQTPPSALVSNSGGRWTSDDTADGVAHVWVAYKLNDQVWQSGRPRFRWRIKGAYCYDPRLDSTVAGGSGSHRWADQTTWAWSENAAICRYNWVRGVWTNSQLMVGPGRTADEAPPAAVIAQANVCDEDVALLAGGTEDRYRVGCVIRADEEWASVEQDFAAAIGGDLIEAAGTLAVDVGVAKSVTATFTDSDLIVGAKVTTQAKLSRADLVNTVKASFVDPNQLWQDNTAPLRRDTSAITADGEPREFPLELRFVTSATQAQRLSAIALKRARLQRSAIVTLGPQHCLTEVGDWVTWTSARYHDGAALTYQVQGVDVAQDGRTTLALREIASSVYAWTAASDEIAPGAAAPGVPSPPGAATIAGAAASPGTISGTGFILPVIDVTWTGVTDPSIARVRVEYRLTAGPGATMADWCNTPAVGQHQLRGVAPGTSYQVRLVAEPDPAREATPTSWITITTTGEAIANSAVPIGVNSVFNALFERGLDGFEVGNLFGTGSGSVTLDRGLNISPDWSGARNVAYSKIVGTPAATVYVNSDLIARSSLPFLQAYALPVSPGARVFARARVAIHRLAFAQVQVAWWDGTGAYISEIIAGTQGGRDGGAYLGLPDNFDILGGFVTAPANSAFATMWIQAKCVGSQVDPTLFWCEPAMGLANSGQTVLPPFDPGRQDPFADRTGDNRALGLNPGGTYSFSAGGARRVGVATETRQVADGDVLTWGPFDAAPIVTFDAGSLPALAAGEAYNLSITSASATGGTVRAKKISTGGTLATQTGTTRTVVNSNPGLVDLQKPTTTDSYSGAYRFSLSGEVEGKLVGPLGEEEVRGSLTISIRYRTTAGGGLTTVAAVEIAATGAGVASFTTVVTIPGFPAIGQHADPEFQLECTARTYTGSKLQDVTQVAYETITGATESTATPGSQKVTIRIDP